MTEVVGTRKASDASIAAPAPGAKVLGTLPGGGTRNFPVGGAGGLATNGPDGQELYAQVAGLLAAQQASAIFAATRVALNAVTGSYVGQGAQVLNGPDAGTYAWTGSEWQFLRGDTLAGKADNQVAASISGVNAALLTEALQAILFQQGLRTRVPGLSLTDAAELEVRDTEDVRGVAAMLMTSGRKVRAYLHETGALVSLEPSLTREPPRLARGGMAHDRDKVYGAAHNQWIFPLFASMNGRVYHASVGLGTTGPRVLGDVQINARVANSRWMQYAIDRQQFVRGTDTVDDHNAPCVLLDPRLDAAHPVMVIGADHSDDSSRLRLWKSTTEDCAAIGAPMVVDVTAGVSASGGMSYAQAFRNPRDPDEVVVLSRQGTSANAVWWMHRTRDGFQTLEAARLFAGDDLYVLAKPSVDGTAQHLVIQQHPRNGVDQRVLYLRYVFADGSLRNAAGSVVVANAWDAPVFQPFSAPGPTVLYEPAAGRNKRLFDAVETSEGQVEVVLVDFSKTDYIGTAMHVLLSGGEPTVTQIGATGSAGYPLEFSNSNAYFAGLAITGPGAVVLARWDRPQPVYGELARWSLVEGGWVKGAVLATSADTANKIGRPVVCIDFRWDGERIVWNLKPSVTFLRGSYTSYSDFKFDMTEVTL